MYDTKISSNILSDIRKEELLRNFGSNNVTESNYFSLEINYAQVQYEYRTESKAMTFTDLLAGIGGSMGLFAGFSLLSVFEVVGELFLLRMVPRMWGDRRLYGVGSV